MKWMKLTAAFGCLVLCANFTFAETPEAGALKKKAAAWLKKNRLSSSDRQQLSQIIDQAIGQNRTITLALGPKLARSRKPTLATTWGDQLFVFSLTSRQAKDMGLTSTSANLSVGEVVQDKRAGEPIMLTRLTIKNSKKMNGDKPLEGTVAFQAGEKAPGKLALRLTYKKDATPISRFQHFTEFPPATPQLAFSLKGLNEEATGAPLKGPVVVFVDLCTLEEGDGDAKITVLSNPRAVLVNVR